jgi:hypothetical protein
MIATLWLKCILKTDAWDKARAVPKKKQNNKRRSSPLKLGKQDNVQTTACWESVVFLIVHEGIDS